MTVLVTGAAGFIGFHTSKALLARGDKVIGIDNLNDYYDVSLKEARLNQLREQDNFVFEGLDIADREAMEDFGKRHPEITRVVHLAAQPGVRYSLINPYAYTRTNVEGHMCVLELCRHLEGLKHLVYASTSSVYGANKSQPFSVGDPTEHPVSLYAATKKSMELMSHTYAHLYRIPQTGLRYFTVYGPWGRPDMSPIIFTRKILAGEPLPVFNHGDMRRDFTYIDDIVSGTLACLDRPPVDDGEAVPCRVYNIGNQRSENLMDFIGLIEKNLDRKAEFDFLPMQPGDVQETYADIKAARRDFGYDPKTTIEQGIPKFIRWYRDFYGG